MANKLPLRRVRMNWTKSYTDVVNWGVVVCTICCVAAAAEQNDVLTRHKQRKSIKEILTLLSTPRGGRRKSKDVNTIQLLSWVIVSLKTNKRFGRPAGLFSSLLLPVDALSFSSRRKRSQQFFLFFKSYTRAYTKWSEERGSEELWRGRRRSSSSRLTHLITIEQLYGT